MADDWTWSDTAKEWFWDTILDKVLKYLETAWGKLTMGEIIAALVIVYAYLKGHPTVLDYGIGAGCAFAFMFVTTAIQRFISKSQHASGPPAEPAKRIDKPDPAIVYECFDEESVPWKSGEKYNYVHLWFRNEPTGGIARDAAAKLSWWDARYTEQKPLFSVDGKWYEVSHELDRRVQAENTIDLLPNRASHGLDLFIRKPEVDWNYALSSSPQHIDERHRLGAGIYAVKVTISCEGYSKDFWFRVATGGTVQVHEYVSADGKGTEVRDEVRR